jgi:hypothetical protein
MGERKEPQPDTTRPEEQALSKLEAGAHLVPEVLEAIQREEGRIDVNVILVQLVQKSQDPEAFVEKAERVLAVTQRFEEQRVENFKQMAKAVIEVKAADPDEIDKRRNNRTRRTLKLTVAGVMASSVVGAITSALMGGEILLTGLFVIVGTLALAMAGPLATGESMSSTDVVRIVTALTKAIPGQKETKGKESRAEPRKARQKGRKR